MTSTSSPLSKAGRVAWFLIGWCAVGIGSVGIVVPGLPTTVFFIAAAACFARSSPRFEQWILDLPRIGPMVRDHRAGLGMPRRAKTWAAVMIVGFTTFAVVLLRERWALAAAIAVLGLIGVGYVIWRIPTKEHVLAERVASEA